MSIGDVDLCFCGKDTLVEIYYIRSYPTTVYGRPINFDTYFLEQTMLQTHVGLQP